MIPVRTPFFLPWIYPSLVWRMPAEKKELFLTFDDGPMPGPTEYVLQVLQNANALATFFCIGDNVRKYPHVLSKVAGAGHAIGNHTFNHLNGWKTQHSIYLENIHRCATEIVSQGFERPTLFRPPYGRIRRNQISALNDLSIIMWDVLTFDFDQSRSAEKCLQDSIKAIRNGSIILFHDSFKAERNMMYVLPRLIDHCLAKGYVFKAISK